MICRASKPHGFTCYRETARYLLTGFVFNRKIQQALISTITNRTPVHYLSFNLGGNFRLLTIPKVYLIFCGIVSFCAYIFDIYPSAAVNGIRPTATPVTDICKLRSQMGIVSPAIGGLTVLGGMVCALPINNIICVSVPARSRTARFR